MRPELDTALIGVIIAALSVATGIIGAVGIVLIKHLPEALRARIEAWAAQAQTARTDGLQRAGEMAAAAAEEAGVTRGLRGPAKLELAKSTAGSLAPATATEEALTTAILAGVTKVRASLASPSEPPSPPTLPPLRRPA